jgi:hypothetical protein
LRSNTPAQIQSDFQGVIFAAYTDTIYLLLQHLDEFTLAQDFYAAGQQVNIVLNDISQESFLLSYLEKLPVKIKNIEHIEPSIEDCFIQLMKDKKA